MNQARFSSLLSGATLVTMARNLHALSTILEKLGLPSSYQDMNAEAFICHPVLGMVHAVHIVIEFGWAVKTYKNKARMYGRALQLAVSSALIDCSILGMSSKYFY